MTRRAALSWCVFTILLSGALGGCSTKTYLMPTPRIYTDPSWDPFAEVPAEFRSDTVSVLYVTDRAPTRTEPDHWRYGTDRSLSAAFGDAVVRFGDGMSWDSIVAASRSEKRPQEVEIKVESVREKARFEKTPATLVATWVQEKGAPAGTETAVMPPPDPRQDRAVAAFRADLTARLAQSRKKEVFLYVHGFDDTFDDAILTSAELWHFFGREGVPVCYTWPAGLGGLEAYLYTLASTQFTVYHLKQALLMIAATPGVERINLIAHSRGTAVLTDALRELCIALRTTEEMQRTLKIGTVVLAAADIDLDVAIERDSTERITRIADHSVLYICDRDKALALSSWLMGGGRVGDISPTLFTKEDIEALRASDRVQIVDARVTDLGYFNHTYFYASPSVSSDLVLLMRYGCAPGAECGRPLGVSPYGWWLVETGYPGKEWKPKK